MPTFSEELKTLIEKHYGTNEEMDKKSNIERNKVFESCYYDLAFILERSHDIVLQIVPIKTK